MTNSLLDWSRIGSMFTRAVGVRHATPMYVCAPGLRYGPLPIKRDSTDQRTRFDCFVARCLTFFERRQFNEEKHSYWLIGMAQRVNTINELSSDQLAANRIRLALKMRQNILTDELLDEALAHAVVAAEKTLQLTPRPNQYLAARAMLQSHFVEMATGEGKTLSIALAAGAIAISGTPVHVLTANDYLAERDASYLKEFYQFLDLQVANADSSQKPNLRRQSYKAPVVYVTAKQVAFDWLNDALEMGSQNHALAARLSSLTRITAKDSYKPMLRGLCLAIVDEADSLLVDEASIPLVLAENSNVESDEKIEATIALGIAEQLREDIDFIVLSATRHIRLSDNGRDELTKLSRNVAYVWRSSRYRQERVTQALVALHLYELDRDYIVRDGQLHLMDAQTGRSMADRRLPHGLHTLLELKEKCPTTPQNKTVASVPFQEFYNRYFNLIGISGTLHEVAGEIHNMYGSSVVSVPSHRPSLRKDIPAEVFLDRSVQLQTMVDDVKRRSELGQPVLVCTRSVEQSLGVSSLLTTHGLEHQVLNAYQDADEAAVVAQAGQSGCVTVATNMAGRGTDIPLGASVSELGGLHVISLAFNDARRLDRQLAGRAARQGDPGSYQLLASLDDPYLTEAMPATIKRCMSFCIRQGWQKVAVMLLGGVKWRIECKHRRDRVLTYKSRKNLERQLAFGGKPEHVS